MVAADTVLSGREGVYHLFNSYTRWVKEIEDPKVRAIAEEISGTVKKTIQH